MKTISSKNKNSDSPPLYTKKQLSALDQKRLPKHIAVIPDGNRRWAKRFLFSPHKGHQQGAKCVTNTVNAALSLGIKTLTVYTFSTENWKRSKTEIALQMKLLKSYLKEQTPNMIRDGVRLHTIGDLTPFSPDIKQSIHETKIATAEGNQLDLVLGLNYGSRDEIRRAVHSIIDDHAKGKIKKEQITEELIIRHLDTAQWHDPELLIRTGGECRISNFLLWQISYSEIYITPLLWPEFNHEHFLEAILDYQKRERRLGGT